MGFTLHFKQDTWQKNTDVFFFLKISHLQLVCELDSPEKGTLNVGGMLFFTCIWGMEDWKKSVKRRTRYEA